MHGENQERTRNSQIGGTLNQDLVTRRADRRELRRFEHLISTDSTKKPRQIQETRVEGSLGRERPRIDWEERVRKLMKKGKNLQETPRLAKDRKAFRIRPMQPIARKSDKRI
jgi:hypothetical protein